MTSPRPDPVPRERPRVVVLTSEEAGRPHNAAALADLAELTWTDQAGLSAALPGAEALLMWDFFSPALREAWPAADRLAWVHIAAAGVDALLFDGLRDSDVLVTNAHGIFDRPIAEFVLASVLAHDKQLHRSRDLQREHVWQHREPARTEGSRALVVGTGGIGRACARLLRAIGVHVTGAGRTPREDDPDFGRVLPSAELADNVGDFDHVVLVAPLTEQTRGLVGARELDAMKPTAHLVNVGRGALLDEAALVDALRSGGLAAASLDVFETEPLPPDSPLWGLANVAISAHMCGDVVGWQDALADQFETNLRRWTAGQTPHNVVDKAAGYVPGSRR